MDSFVNADLSAVYLVGTADFDNSGALSDTSGTYRHVT